MAGSTLRRRALNVAMETVRGASLLRRPPIPWEITWFPTWTCNLKCYYCCVPHENFYKPNPEKACQKIIDQKPASVSILGGEPFLIKEMPDYLRRIRQELPNVYLFITTNGIVSTEKLVQSAPYLNVLCFSIDGFDEYNKKPRGVGSDRIMKNVWAYNDARKKLDGEHEICINTVVTADNAKHLPDFIQHIADKDPSIYVMCQAMHPINAPTGLGNFPELTEEFITRIAKMQKEGVRVFLVGMLADDRTRMKSDESHVDEAPVEKEEIHHRICQEKLHTCHQEKFFAMVVPHGALHTCRTYASLTRARVLISEAIHNRKPLLAMKHYYDAWKDLVFRPFNFECGHFTGCPEWLEDIITTKGTERTPEEIARIRGRLYPESIQASAQFIRRYINPDFDEGIIK